MVEIFIRDWRGDAGQAVIEESERLDLIVHRDGRLGKFAGSRHWHLKKGRRPGTLEVTLWLREDRLWVAYHSNRIGDGWVAESAVLLASALASRLGGYVG